MRKDTKSTLVEFSYDEFMAKNGKRTGRPAGMGDTNKRRLLEAAREQFSSQGFRSVTMRSIAAEAGVDVALIAHHFGSKEGLYAVVVDREMRALTEALGPHHQLGQAPHGHRLDRRD